MSRRTKIEKRELAPDYKYGDVLLAKFINCVMWEGKKSIAQNIVYGAMDIMMRELSKSSTPSGDQNGEKSELEMFKIALTHVYPAVEVKTRRIGGANYQVPVQVSARRAQALAIRWIIKHSRDRSGMPMVDRLAKELIDAYNNTGASVKKREDTTKMAEANKAFSSYRW